MSGSLGSGKMGFVKNRNAGFLQKSTVV